jgi:hypothetical protein
MVRLAFTLEKGGKRCRCRTIGGRIFSRTAFISVYMHCPHCDTPSTFSVSAVTQEFSANTYTYYAILLCNSLKCRKYTYVITTKGGAVQVDQDHQRDSLTIYPSGPEPTAHRAIPSPIAKDWTEAQKAFNVGATKAAAMMCRRILYGVILDKKCPEHPLHAGIQQLCSQERLPSIVERWLGEIKEDGHDAAHPSRALDVRDENVAETLEYTKELLRFVYIEPFELKERLARKAGGAGSAAPTASSTGAGT